MCARPVSTSPASGPAAATSSTKQIGDPDGDPENRVGTAPDVDAVGAIWFDRNAFKAPATGTFATTQEKNSLRQPGFWDVNMLFRKGFSVAGCTQRFDLRIEAFNILNRARLGNAVTNPTSGDFGYIVIEGRQPDDADRDAVHLLME